MGRGGGVSAHADGLSQACHVFQSQRQLVWAESFPVHLGEWMLACVDSALAQRPLSSHGESRRAGSCMWPGCTAGTCPGSGVLTRRLLRPPGPRAFAAPRSPGLDLRGPLAKMLRGVLGVMQVGLGVRFALGAQSDRFSCKAFHVGAQFLTQNIV